MVYLFWLSLGVILYTYFFYPALLCVWSSLASRPVLKKDVTPKVSVFICAFNEASIIASRVENLLEQDYPRECLEIWAGSDGSTDDTYAIIKRLAEEKHIRYAVSFQRKGKPAMLNKMTREATGDIYVFADARQRFEKDAIRQLVRCFGDPQVGAVSGELMLEDREAGAGRGIGLYWRYEKEMRRMESAVGSMMGATGAIYAARKEHFHYLPENIILDDLYTPFNAIMAGQRAIFEPAARAWDQVSPTTQREFTRKVRTLVGNFQIFSVFREAFIPFKSPIAFQLFSHKFLRLMVPYALVAFFVASIFLALSHLFYLLALILQVIFYSLALVASIWEGSGVRVSGLLRLAHIPHEFCVLNLAAVVALKRYALGQVDAAWEK